MVLALANLSDNNRVADEPNESREKKNVRTNKSTVRATTRSGYMMTSPTFAKWRPRRETRGKVTSGSLLRLEVSFPHTTLRAVTLDNEKSGV